MVAIVQNTSLLALTIAAGVVVVLAAGAVVTTQAQTDVTAQVQTDATAQTGVLAHEEPDGEPPDPEAEEKNDSDDTDNETRTTVSGTLESLAGEDYSLDGLAIDIGAEWYTNSTTAETDFNGDGTVETIRAEFDGLVGQSVTLTVETDGTEGDVFAVDGEQYREQGPPPWAGGPNGNGPPDNAGPGT